MTFGRLRPARLCRFSPFLCAVLFVQTTTAPLRAQREAVGSLSIVVLEGDGALNSIRSRTAQDVAVRLEDDQNRPIPGASVTFQLPQLGPSSRFQDGSTIMIVTTDAQGQARVGGMQPNSVQGEFQIQVAASHQGRRASATITQSNVTTLDASIGGSSTKWLIFLALAGGAGAALALAKGGGGSGGSSSRPAEAGTITIIPGAPVVTGPR